jgi:hypothetical protein
MLVKIRNTNFRGESRTKIAKMVEIIEEYSEQNLRLTARQLYYQFVSRDLIANTPAEYKKLTALLTDARYAGLVDWGAIEDRGRVPEIPSEWSSIASLVRGALQSYRLPRWANQDCYVELWVEKQALAGVLAPLANEFHVPLMVNKGYSSASAMYESAQRIISCAKLTIIFYLGDHDPSGEDMVRDIQTRLEEFGVEDLVVRKLALTMDQVQQYNPPPNSAKITDSRAAAYITKFGNSSWEIDALPPNVLSALIRQAFLSVIDMDAMDEVKAREEKDRAALQKAAEKLTKGKRND